MKKVYIFEDLLFRKDILIRCKNLDQGYISKYSTIIGRTSSMIYKKHHDTFSLMGYEFDDIVSATSLFVMYYKELYSIESNGRYFDKTWEKIEKRHGKGYNISNEEWEKIEKSNMINFVRGLFIRFVKLCHRKNENIIAGKIKHGYFKSTPSAIEADYNDISNYPNHFGYKEITETEYNRGVRVRGVLRGVDGFEILKISTPDFLKEDDYVNIMYDRATYLSDPEEILIQNRVLHPQEELEVKFDKLSHDEKMKKLKEFVKNNSKNKLVKEEVLAAKAILKDMLI